MTEKERAVARLEPYVLFLGRLDQKKGLLILVEAFARVAAARDDLRLIVAGPDRNRIWPAVEKAVKNHGLIDKVRYVGFVDETRKAALMTNAEVFVLPSSAEGMSTAVIEALGFGIPVVISEACNLPEVESSGAGFVVPPEELAVSKAILKIVGDPANRDTMGASARRLAEASFSISRMAREMVEFYEEALSN